MTKTDTPSPSSQVDAAPSLGQLMVPTPSASLHQQVLKAHNLMAGWAARSAATHIAAARLFAFGMNTQTWTELLLLNEAAWQRGWKLQENWLRGWKAWSQECRRVRRANTMSKFVEQEFDLLAQLGHLLSDQATDLVTLQENIDVDYGYWVNEKLKSISESAAAKRVALATGPRGR
jgi:hypothetical protein